MTRTEKEAFVTDLSKGVQDAQTFALMSFSKLTVEQMTQFRLSLRKKDVHVKVVKNTLAERVFAETPFKAISEHLSGPTLLAYSSKDSIVAAKAIVEWVGKEGVELKIKAGMALGELVNEQKLKALSKLPGKNELLVSFLWALKSSPTKFLYALNDAPRRLGYALQALKTKKEKEAA